MDAIAASPLMRHVVILGSVLLAPALASATVLNITSAGQYRDHRGPNSVEFSVGDRHLLLANVKALSGATAPDDTLVSAFNDPFEIELRRSSDITQEFVGSRTFGTIPTTPWTIAAESGGDSVSELTHDITSAPLLPLVRNVRIEPDGLTPTLLWDAPLSGVPASVDRVNIGFFDDDSNDRLPFLDGSLFKSLPATTTSFTFEPGELEEDTNYVFRVILVDSVPGGGTLSRSLSFVNFTTEIVGGDDTVFLPTVDAEGVFRFDFDVESGRRFLIDPFVATGYEYAIGTGDPNFASVELPLVGDGDFLLSYLVGGSLTETSLAAGDEFLFPAGGVNAFTITGIEASAMLDPADVTAFATTLSVVTDGAFTGTMTPITEFVPESVSGPPTVLLLGLGSIFVGYARRRRPTP